MEERWMNTMYMRRRRWLYLEGLPRFAVNVYSMLAQLSNFQIAENKHNHLQQMTDSSVKHSQVEPQPNPTSKLSRTLSIFSPLSVLIPKREQSIDCKRKNILESQITQEHSGISYAFKGHQFVLVIEKMKMRRLYKYFGLLVKQGSEGKIEPICSLHDREDNHQNKSVLHSKQREELLSLPDTEDNCPVAELPIVSLLQSKNTHKFLSRELFQSRLKVTALQGKISSLEEELNEANRRQEKEMQKKRSSLESLAQEISEKNEVIEELKIMVKSLETKLCLKLKNTAFILEEDSDSLRKAVIHLETVNDKLNFDLSKTKEREKTLRQQVKELSTENDRLKQEINRLREELFASDNFKSITATNKKECQLWQSRLRKRELKVAAMERKVNEISRGRVTHSYQKISTFWTQKNFTPLPTTNSAQDFLADNKVQSILSFLFHIQSPSYELQSPQLFDQEEKALLSSHKEKIANMMQGKDLSFSQFPNVIEKSQSLNDFGLTVIDLIEKQAVNAELQNNFQQSLKELRFQNQRTRLRQQISELKEKQLIVRGVLLNFLKSLELRSVKKESLNILDLLFECFEYSQDQRTSIFQQKTKKFFGFI